MPRRPRAELSGIPLHIVQRGNNRLPCFFHDEDRQRYLKLLAEQAGKREVAVHAYVLMTNHVHLLVTPANAGGASALMQNLGREYVTAVNAAYRRTGSLWEGRFHACLVQSDGYALACMRYIELNPVRAGMVARPEDYPWSSHRVNAFAGPEPPLFPGPFYRALGATHVERTTAYLGLFAEDLDASDVTAIRAHTQQAAAWGNDRFRAEIEAALGRRVALLPRGRPPRMPGEPDACADEHQRDVNHG